jgi:hypothetical protein
MVWERVGRRAYYYRHVRVGGKPRRLYVGTGLAAELAAAADAARRLARETQKREQEVERTRRAEAEASFLTLCDVVSTLGRAALLAAGYHRHERGVWRRRRREHPDGHPE